MEFIKCEVYRLRKKKNIKIDLQKKKAKFIIQLYF